MHSAFLITDSRYWLQAQEEIDENWSLVKAGSAGEPQDWIEWIVVSNFFPFPVSCFLFCVLRFAFLLFLLYIYISINSFFFSFTDFINVTHTEPSWIFKNRNRRSHDIS